TQRALNSSESITRRQAMAQRGRPRRRKSVEFWRVGGRRRPAAGTILPEPVKILEGPAAEGIHAAILGFPSLELQLKLGRKLNLELHRKCRGAAPPRAVVIHFQGERRYAQT